MILALPLGHMITVRDSIYIICVKGKKHQITAFTSTPHICTEMYRKEEEQEKTPLFTMENESVAWK